jgi:hypothetical protein
MPRRRASAKCRLSAVKKPEKGHGRDVHTYHGYSRRRCRASLECCRPDYRSADAVIPAKKCGILKPMIRTYHRGSNWWRCLRLGCRPASESRRQTTRGERRGRSVMAQVRFVSQRTNWRARLLASAASDSPFVKRVGKSHMRTRYGRYRVLRTRV